MKTVSIIIPVYNAEKYLAECLESVLKQTLNDFEVICIDDGSADNSLKMLEGYRQTDKRVTILTQENQGAGAARNAGLAYAHGKYIAFLDADDFYTDKDALKKMYDLCERKGVDICGSYSKMLRPDGDIVNICLYETELRAGDVFYYRDYQFDYGYYCFIYRKRLLDDYNISFPLYRRNQDPPFLVRCFYYAEKFTIADTYLYCYRAPNMIFRYNYEKIIDLVSGIRDVMKFASENHLDKLLYKKIERLNYDYCNIICHNLNEKDNRLLSLLLDTDQWIKENTTETDSIRVLQKIITNTITANKKYGEEICKWIVRQKRVILYGAGGLAGQFLRFLNEKKIIYAVKGIVVSETGGSKKEIFGIPVIDFSEYLTRARNEQDVILIAVGADFQKEIIDLLKMNQIFNYEIVDDVFMRKMTYE